MGRPMFTEVRHSVPSPSQASLFLQAAPTPSLLTPPSGVDLMGLGTISGSPSGSSSSEELAPQAVRPSARPAAKTGRAASEGRTRQLVRAPPGATDPIRKRRFGRV